MLLLDRRQNVYGLPSWTSLEEILLCLRHTEIFYLGKHNISQTIFKHACPPTFSFNSEKKQNPPGLNAELIADCVCLLNCVQIFNL